ncbi:unnamed protein product [Clavelina lepadiformis]|uniref:Uncharacterized protein n=1 Tax=Clavelina lepadiformis TaxID=159417 RepID=A0ABP0FD66_CLALP
MILILIHIDPVPTNTESYSVNVNSTSIDLCDGRNIGLDAAGVPEMPESLPAHPIDVEAVGCNQSAVSGNSSKTSSSKKRSMKKAKVSRSSMQQKDTVDESDNNVNAKCFYSNEMYSKSSENDGGSSAPNACDGRMKPALGVMKWMTTLFVNYVFKN